MSADVTNMQPGQVAATSDLNATVDSINAAFADIGPASYADEGLDRRSVAARTVTPARGMATPYANPWTGASCILGSPGAFSLLTLPAGDVVFGPISYDRPNGEMVRVRSVVNFYMQSGGVPAFRLAYSTDGGATWVPIDVTGREFKFGGAAANAGWRQYAVGHMFSAGGSSFSAADLRFCVQFKTAGGIVDVGAAVLYAQMKAR